MEKTTNLKVRLLALALTALMVVGMLPMSIFAISAKPADNSAPTTDYRKADISDIIDGLYNKDAKYWTLIYKDTESGTQATTTYGGTSSLDKRNTASFENGVLTVPGDGSGNAQYRNINTQYNNVQANLFNKNLGGIDVAVKLQLKVDASMDEVATEGTSSIGMGFDLCNWGAQNHVLGVIKTSGEVGARKYELYAYDGTTKLCDLSSTEYVTVEALCDVGAFGGAMYIYINGEFVYSVNLAKTNKDGNGKTRYNTTSDLAHQASIQASWGDYAKGPLFGGFICAAGTAGYNVKNMSAFYYDDTPDDGDVTNAARETNIAYYNSFDENVDNLVYSGVGAGYMQQRVGTKTIENGEIAFKTILDKTDYKFSINTYVQSYDANTKTYKANSGKNFVYQLDYKLGDVIWGGTLATFSCNTIDGSTDNGTIAQAAPVTMDGDGKVFAGGKQIATLSADKYTTIGYAVNVANNTVDVYVDGLLAAEGVKFLTDAQDAAIKATEGFEKGFALSFIGLYRQAKGDQYNGTAFYYDNVTLYYGSYIANTIEPDKTDASYIAPTGAEIDTALGANGSLLYYNDYNSAAQCDSANLNASAYRVTGNKGNECYGATLVSDGNGGKALKITHNSSSNFNHNCYITDGAYRNTTPEYQGMNFVFSADFKYDGNIVAGSLISLNCYVNAGNINTMLVSLPVWVDTDGTLYVSDPDKLTPSEGSITGGLVYELNKINNEGLDAGKKGTKIGKLSSEEFTNVAVQVKDNKLSVYVNGVCKVSDLLFMSDSAKEYFAANKDTAFEDSNEFALSGFGFGYRQQSSAGHSVINDNVTLYKADTFVLGTTEVTSLYDAEKQTGYKYENGGIYYYENGALVKNTVSADGILTIDANGQVFFGDTAVTSMGDYYKYVGNEIVPKDGFYSGIYRGNMLLGANEGSYYYFDTNKNLVTGKTVYDITEDGGVTLGYAINANGVIGDLYSGMATLDDGVYIYANGVRKTGFIEYNGKNYFAEEDGTLFKGEKTIEGLVWDFDASTFEGSKRDGLWIVNEGEDGEYANLYIMGELQTTTSDNGALLTHNGKNYYISAGETSKLYKGNGVKMIDEKPYAFDGYVATLISDAVYNGYYYDNSGVIKTDEFFYGKNKAGETVVYHANTETGALIAGGIGEFEGFWYGFNELNADEPYIGIKLNGVYKIGEDYRYYINGILYKNMVLADGDAYYLADGDGNLVTVENGTIYYFTANSMYYVNVGDTDAPYKFSVVHGVIKSRYDGENETYRYFVNGLLKTEDVSFGAYSYIILENGDLATNPDTNRPLLYKGKWYLKYAETEYGLVLADGIYVISDSATEEYAGKRKLFSNGEIVAGDANGEIFVNGSFCYKYDENGSLYCDNDDGVVCADGKTYDFDENCGALLRTGYNTSKDGYVWVDGKKVTDGIHFVPVEGGEIEMYFKDGKASAGEIVVEDGSVHKFGEDGKRYIEEGATEPEDKYPHSIVIITYVKDGDTTTELARREFYRFWHNSFSYTPYYFCYGYTITVNGTEITAANGELLKVYIEASDENDHVIIVTFDKSTDCHTEWVKDDEQCTSATCKQGGIDVYVCNICGRNGRKEVNTPIDESKHSFTVNTVDATHTTMGTRTTTCENGCDYCKVEYLPMLAHEWTEVEGSRVAPTCGVNGSVSYSCTCGATKTETLKATGLHNYVLNGYKEPTCAVDGSVNYVCSECQGTYSIKLPATCKHTHGEDDPYTVISDKSEDYETRIYDCNVCGKVGAIAETVSVTSDEEE